jgi:hypothetical protein
VEQNRKSLLLWNEAFMAPFAQAPLGLKLNQICILCKRQLFTNL